MRRFKSKQKFKRKRFIKRNTNKYCRFTAEEVDQIDYKDIGTLKKYIKQILIVMEQNREIFSKYFADGYQWIYKGSCTVMQTHFVELYACMKSGLKWNVF